MIKPILLTMTMIFLTLSLCLAKGETQIWPYKDGDVVKERHVYNGPLGEGYIDIEYKEVDGKMMVKETHYGPENRPSFDWQEVYPKESKSITEKVFVVDREKDVTTSTADPKALVLKGECVWLQDEGLKITESYKDSKMDALTAEVNAEIALEETK